MVGGLVLVGCVECAGLLISVKVGVVVVSVTCGWLVLFGIVFCCRVLFVFVFCVVLLVLVGGVSVVMKISVWVGEGGREREGGHWLAVGVSGSWVVWGWVW